MKIQALILLAIPALAACGEPTCEEAGDVCAYAGTGTPGFLGDEGPATEADLYLPMDLVFGPDQRAYVLDWNNHRIRTIDEKGVIRTVAGSGELGDDIGVELDTSFNHPTNAVFDGEGNLLIAAWHNSRIKRFHPKTGVLENICGTGKRAYTGDGGSAKTADLDLPTAIALDPQGNLFILDQANQVIRKVDAGTDVITRYAGKCVIGSCGDGEVPAACAGTGKFACGLATQPDACSLPCGAGFGGDGGDALEARISMAVGQAAPPGGRMAFDAQGNLYFADTNNHRIRKVDANGVITTFAGVGTSGFSGDGGPATSAQLKRPIDLEFGADGTLYVADTGNSCVRAISNGTIRTVAGKCGERGNSGDGESATAALFDTPFGLAVHRDSLYVADTQNSRIRRVLLE